MKLNILFFYGSSCLKFLVKGLNKMSKPRFTIIEGKDNFEELYLKFEKDYLGSELTISEILSKHNISQNMYKKLLKAVYKRTGYKRPKHTHLKKYRMRCIEETKSGNYRIRRTPYYYGTYPSLEIALKVRSILDENDWDVSLVPQLREMYTVPKESFMDSFKEYDEFANDYLEGMSLFDLMEKYNISKYFYQKLSAKVKNDYNLTVKPKVKV